MKNTLIEETQIKSNNISYITPVNSLDPQDAFKLYANPVQDSKKPIVLVRPPIIFSKGSYSTPVALPIGLAYIGGVLEASGYCVKLIDCPSLAMNRIYATADNRFHVRGINQEESIKLIPTNTDIIGLTIMFSQEWPFVKRYIQQIRRAFPEATIVVGGEHVTAMPQYSLQDCPSIDYIVVGEGELTFLELIYSLRSKKDINHMKGLAFIKNGQYNESGKTFRIAKIKTMPWPAWHLVDLEPYFTPNFTMGLPTGRNIAFLATRGCPYQCTFCSSPTMWTTKYTMRDVNDVVDEIEHYVKTMNIKGIDFYDLTAVVKKDWIMDLITALKERKLDIVWQLPSGTRSEALDEEVLSGLAQTGCRFVVYAPESGSEETLYRIKKRVKIDRLVESIKKAIKNGMIVKVNFIIGFPFEKRKNIYQTLLLVWKLALLKTNDCNIATFSPYPGSELYRELVAEGTIGMIDDAYFEGLMTQFDLTFPMSYCKNVGGVELMIYRIIGMSIFYILSYVRCPSRLLRLFKIFFSKEWVSPHSVLEQRMFDIKSRLSSKKKMEMASQCF